MTDQPGALAGTVGGRLNTLLEQAGLPVLDAALARRFENYLGLIRRWNARTNLTAIRDEDGILSRHFVESIACARAVPPGVGTLLDLGSGAGFPGIPIALCRPEITVTLAESQNKKAAFLREAVRTLGLVAKVHDARAEELKATFDCVTLRAVDRMESAVASAARLVGAKGWLVIMTTEGALLTARDAAGPGYAWQAPIALPGGQRRIGLGQKAGLTNEVSGGGGGG